MRILNIAVVAATLLVPTVGYSQDNGRVGGLIGPNLELTVAAHLRVSVGDSSRRLRVSFARAVI